MAFRSSSTSSTSVTGGSFTVPIPTGAGAPQTDDIAFLFVTIDAPATIGWPSGFTAFPSTFLTGDGQQVGGAWKRQGATPDSGSYTISGAPSGSDPRAILVIDSGRDTANPPVLGSTVTNNSGNASPVTVSVTGLTASLGDDLLFVMFPDTHASVSQVFTAPSGFIDAVSEGTGASWSNEQVSIKENVGSGVTGTVSGSFTCTGTVAGYEGWLIRVPAGTAGPNTGSASGTIALSGSASGSRSSSGSASGSLSTSGTATGSRPSEGSATGTMTLAGSASGQQPPNVGAAFGALTLSGSASGSKPSGGTASGTITVTGAGTGSRTASGVASGALTVSGTASGTAPAVGGSGGAASGLLTLLGSASGSRASSGAATGAVSLSGAASGTRASSGAASGSVGLSGAAAGQAPIPGMHQGTAAGIIVVLGDASGSRMSSGSASGTLTLTSTAAGQDPPNVGAASGTLVLAGTATGTNVELRNLTVLAVVAVPRTTTVRDATRQTEVAASPRTVSIRPLP